MTDRAPRLIEPDLPDELAKLRRDYRKRTRTNRGKRGNLRAYRLIRNGWRSFTGRWHASPDFLIVGAQKAATTSLFYNLVQHPLVVGPWVKELHWLDRNPGRSLLWYQSFFPTKRALAGEPRRLTGEATPDYLATPGAAQQAAQLLPDAKILVLLRDPVQRAYSHYQMGVRKGFERRSFDEILEIGMASLEEHPGGFDPGPHATRAQRGPHTYLSRGLYADQLAPWMEAFGDRLMVLFTQDVKQRPQETYDQVLAFLGLPAHELEQELKLTVQSYEPIPKKAEKRLRSFYKGPDERLAALLGRPVPWQ